MQDPSINRFFSERKAAKIKKLLNVTQDEASSTNLMQIIDEEFTLQNWLPDAARKAQQLSIVSHSSKFTHPKAKTSPIIAQQQTVPDGFLRTGNTCVELDVTGNAGALDVYKFLMLKLSDGQTILQHLEQ